MDATPQPIRKLPKKKSEFDIEDAFESLMEANLRVEALIEQSLNAQKRMADAVETFVNYICEKRERRDY